MLIRWLVCVVCFVCSALAPAVEAQQCTPQAIMNCCQVDDNGCKRIQLNCDCSIHQDGGAQSSTIAKSSPPTAAQIQSRQFLAAATCALVTVSSASAPEPATKLYIIYRALLL